MMDRMDLIRKSHEIYPSRLSGTVDGDPFDSNEDNRLAYVNGYEAGQSENELGWRDIKLISELLDEVKNDFCDNPDVIGNNIKGDVTPDSFRKAFCCEVLDRYNKKKNEDKNA